MWPPSHVHSHVPLVLRVTNLESDIRKGKHHILTYHPSSSLSFIHTMHMQYSISFRELIYTFIYLFCPLRLKVWNFRVLITKFKFELYIQMLNFCVQSIHIRLNFDFN
jgi:hypothetical protein